MLKPYLVSVMRHPTETYTFPLFTWRFRNRKQAKDQHRRALRAWGNDPLVMIALQRLDTGHTIRLQNRVQP